VAIPRSNFYFIFKGQKLTGTGFIGVGFLDLMVASVASSNFWAKTLSFIDHFLSLGENWKILLEVKVPRTAFSTLDEYFERLDFVRLS
jgi:hypothetical protein